MSENLEAKDWYDELSFGDPTITGSSGFSTSNTANGYLTAPQPSTATLSSSNDTTNSPVPSKNTPEIYTGFVWWPSVAPPAFNASINGTPTELGYASDMFYARPSSSHPGIVVVSFADGRTQTISENINYIVFCLIMTPDGARCTPTNSLFMPSGSLPSGSPFINFRQQIVSGNDLN